jgi:hypothetical protein
MELVALFVRNETVGEAYYPECCLPILRTGGHVQ